jgi:hypothetical protein
MSDELHNDEPNNRADRANEVAADDLTKREVISADESVVVLSTNFTIGPLFSRGCLLPPAVEDPEYPSSSHWSSLQRASGAFPRVWSDEVTRGARNVFPIGVRLKRGHGVRSIPVDGVGGAIDAIGLADVERLLFRSQSELERFSGLDFSNYDSSEAGRLAAVEAAVFEGEDTTSPDKANPTAAEHAPPVADDRNEPGHTQVPASVLEAIRLADCRTAIAAFLFTSSPGKPAWMRGIEALGSRKHGQSGGTWPGSVLGVVIGETPDLPPVDRALLTAAVSTLRQMPLEKGWPAESLLREVSEDAIERLRREVPESSRDCEAVLTWRSRAAEVLSSRAEPHSMADDAFPLRRALLFLLLRGDLDSMCEPVSGRVSRLGPGPTVQGIAGLLAAYRTGIRAMPTRYKTAGNGSTKWLEYLGDVFMRFVGSTTNQGIIPDGMPHPKAKYRSVRALQGEWIVSLSREEIARVPLVVDPALERLLAIGRQLGFDFQEHGEEQLVALVPQPTNRSREVYVQILAGTVAGAQMVRFYTKPIAGSSQARTKKLSRETAVRLLECNSAPNMACRFAIDQSGEVVVLADQLLATLDDDEFRHHVTHVAEVAEHFEEGGRPASELASDTEQ